MKLILALLFSLIMPASLLADDFVTLFMEKCAEDDRPLNNVNIGKTMLDKMAANTDDEELKTAFKGLNSIRIVSSDNQEDSNFYFQKADELIKESFSDYEEAVSLSGMGSKTSVWMKKSDEDKQDLILLAIDGDGKLSIITVSGKIDFDSLSKLPGSLRNGQQLP